MSREVCDFDDLLSRFKRQDLDLHGAKQGRLRRTILKREISLLKRYEIKVTKSWDKISVANEHDAETLSNLTGRSVVTVPNVVDVSRLPLKPVSGQVMLFVGHLGYSPNAHGLSRFLIESWPLIRAENPAIRLLVVGMSPSGQLADLVTNSGAELHANVPSVEPYYAQSDIVIAPIWQGGGTRIKILEAMAYGRPVVSTTVGAEGLGVRPGDQALIADAPRDFADAVLRLLNDNALRASVAARGLELQKRRFSREAVSEAIGTMMTDRRQT